MSSSSNEYVDALSPLQRSYLSTQNPSGFPGAQPQVSVIQAI
jgi:hypothetical protein